MNIKLLRVSVQPKTFDKYRRLLTPAAANALSILTENLKGETIAHLSVSHERGGVARSLHSLVALSQNLGINMQWYVLPHDQKIFMINRQIRDHIQGKPGFLKENDFKLYMKYNQILADRIQENPHSVWVIHDYQTLGAVEYLPNKELKKIWHFHNDLYLKQKNEALMNFLKRFSVHFNHYIFTANQYIPQDIVDTSHVSIFTPALDLLEKKNKPMSTEKANRIISLFGIDAKRPLITQISRFNPWKDPIGVLKAYQTAKRKIPKLQIAFVAHLTVSSDPESMSIFSDLQNLTKRDPDVHFVVNPNNNDLVVAAFQTASNIILQKSIREGFGQTVMEAMWRKKTVIGGDTSGIRLQIDSGKNGYIVKTNEECAERIIELLNNKTRCKRIGLAAKNTVIKKFLFHQYVLNYLLALHITAHSQ